MKPVNVVLVIRSFLLFDGYSVGEVWKNCLHLPRASVCHWTIVIYTHYLGLATSTPPKAFCAILDYVADMKVVAKGRLIEERRERAYYRMLKVWRNTIGAREWPIGLLWVVQDLMAAKKLLAMMEMFDLRQFVVVCLLL